MDHTQKSMSAKATQVLIELEGGRRFCTGCQSMRDASGFAQYKTKRGAVLRCAVCTERRRAGARRVVA